MAIRYVIEDRLRRLARGVLPPVLLEPGWGLFTPATVRVNRLSADAEDFSGLDGIKPGQKVRGVIPPSALLRRDMSLPVAAIGRAEAAIALNLRQSLPAGAEGVIWRSDRARIHGGKADYVVHIARKDHLDALRVAVERSGGRLESVFVDGFGPLSGTTGTDRPRRVWLTGAVCFAAMMAVLSVFAIERRVAQLRTESSALSDQISALQDRAVTARDASQSSRKSTDQLKSDLGIFTMQAGRAEVLVSLSQVLPDEVWISELTVSADAMYLSGFTQEDIAEVVQAIQGLPWVKAARLNAPVRVDGMTGESRFEIAVQIAGEKAS